jgi:hypothetical protein
MSECVVAVRVRSDLRQYLHHHESCGRCSVRHGLGNRGVPVTQNMYCASGNTWCDVKCSICRLKTIRAPGRESWLKQGVRRVGRAEEIAVRRDWSVPGLYTANSIW